MTAQATKHERPILFSGPMVRAGLAGRKTQTRRIVKLGGILDFERGPDGVWRFRTESGVKAIRCPYGVPGDLLWGRESWSESDRGCAYMADHPGDPRGLGWRPSIHMPRWASRLTLRVTDVRVERLNDISEADAIAEGVFPETAYGGLLVGWLPAEDQRDRFFVTARSAYRALWEHLHGPGSWIENPFVWAVSFEPVPQPQAKGAEQ